MMIATLYSLPRFTYKTRTLPRTTYLKKTVGSFEKRRKLCIEAKGGRIKY